MRAVFQMVLGLLVFWLLVLLYMNSTLHQSDGISNQMQSQLENALNELDGLKKQNEKLRSLAQDLKNYMNFNSASKNKRQARITNLENPMKGHEVLRRSVENGVVEFWYHVSSQLGYIKKDLDGQQTNSAQNRIQDLIDAGADHQRYILKDLFNLTMLSDDWRKKESDSLGRLVQSRISFLQNPKDCSKARKLVCNINKGCGYGCQLHHLVYCFLIAYGTERTLILESRGWRYSTYGWEKYFLPLSNTCVDRSGASSHGWGKNTDDTQVVELPIVDSLHPRPPYMPLAIPKDLSDRLIALHGNPFVWWCGQFIKYLTRPQPSLAEDMKNVGSKLNFKNPIVGVHVRRTDKIGSEAAFHNLHEYMSHVDNYFSRLELQRTVDVRRVYLATDDPGVLDEARTRYPLYEFISDASFSKTASVSSRYSDESLRAIILDIHFLSLSDYLVCTFSSQVCRVAYEIMQTLHPDATNQFKSLDDVYYFGGQTGHNQIAIAAHKARSDEEIDLLPGDIIGVAGNHWDGFSKGRNQRTGRTGIYPSYKVQEHWNIVPFPTYPEVSDES